MKKVNWSSVLIRSNIGQEMIPQFVNRQRSLRSIRQVCPKGSVILSEVYKLEKMGVNRARAAARKALQRKRKLGNSL